jgi:hypothetical protein
LDLLSVAGTLVRRWYIILPIVLLGALGAMRIAATTASEYTATGTYLLTANARELGGESSSPSANGSDLAGASDSSLLAAILGLDRRYVANAAAEGEPSFAFATLDGMTLQIDAWADDTGDLDALLDDVAEQADAALAEGVRLGVAGRTEPSSVEGERGEYRAGMILQMVGGQVEGGGGLTPEYVGRVLGELMLSRGAIQEVAQAEPGARFSLSMQPQDLAPIVTVSAMAADPEAALSAHGATVEVASERLERIQDAQAVLQDQRLELAPLTAPTSPQMTNDPGRRPAISLFGLSLLAGVMAALAMDGVASARRRGGREPLAAERRGRWNRPDDDPDDAHPGLAPWFKGFGRRGAADAPESSEPDEGSARPRGTDEEAAVSSAGARTRPS